MPDRTVLDDGERIYVYDGSYNGLFTAVFDAVYSRRPVRGIAAPDRLQLALGARFIEVATDPSKARRVISAAREKLGAEGMARIYRAYLSSDDRRETAIYRYLMHGFRMGRRANDLLTDPSVFRVFSLSQNVSRETDKMMGFIRFSVMEGGVQYCRFSPENNIMPLVLSHFAARFPNIPLVMHDTKHNILGISDTKERYIVSAEGFTPPPKSSDEECFEALWNLFYKTIGIKERTNLRLMKQMMPARYFRHIWEMTGPSQTSLR